MTQESSADEPDNQLVLAASMRAAPGFRTRKFKTGDTVFRAGDRDHALYVVDSGLVSAVYETHDGGRYIKSFFAEQDVVANLYAIHGEVANTFTLECLEDSVIGSIPYRVLQSVAEKDLEVAKAAIGLLSGLAAKKERREFEFLCLSAEERYSALLESRPELADRVLQKDLACYLGITPVSLSRIRRRITT